MIQSRRSLGRYTAVGAAVAIGLGLLAAPGTAHAYWRGGFFFGGPIVIGPVLPPPVYYPPPVVYAPPPPVVYSPPGYAQPGGPATAESAPSCYAGAYVCPLQYAVPAGANCSCYSNQGRPIPGRAGG